MAKRLTISLTGSTSSIGMGGVLARLEAEQAPQRGQMAALVVDGAGVLLEDLVALGPGGVLELEDGVGVEQVVLAFAAPLVLTADGQLAVGLLGWSVGEGHGVALRHLAGDLVEPDAAEPGHGAGEELVDQVLGQADGLEDLGAGVGGHRGDAHLGHHLEHALAAGLDVVAHRLDRVGHLGQALGDEVLDGLEGQVGVDGRCPVPEEQGHVVHFAGVAGLDDQPDPGAGLLSDEVVVHRRDRQQRRDRRQLGRAVAVGEDQDVRAGLDGLARLPAKLVERGAQAVAAPVDPEEARQHRRVEVLHAVVGVDGGELGQLVVVDDRTGELDLATDAGLRVEQVALGADGVRRAR